MADRIEVTVPRNAHQYPTRCARCYGGGALTPRKIGFDKRIAKETSSSKSAEYILPEVPFCKRCATWQTSIVGLGVALAAVGLLVGVGIGYWLAHDLELGRVGDWIGGILAAVLMYPGYLVTQYRDKTVQISAYTSDTLTFSFERADYAAQFMKVNHIRPKPGQLPPA